MKGLIINHSKHDGLPKMSEIFNLLPEEELEKNWLISDYIHTGEEFGAIPYNGVNAFFSGYELKRILSETGLFFIWGVFTSFDKRISYEEISSHPFPLSDGNKEMWDLDIHILHPLGDTEIIPWDASLVLMKSKNPQLIDSYRKEFPHNQDLYEYLTEED
ncbi:hypothetical protein HYQ40_08885 [Aerococcaceae bacterium DSM 111021]|nr:hypothetical protein [Aerococcaceae bacterium DSM 111021]